MRQIETKSNRIICSTPADALPHVGQGARQHVTQLIAGQRGQHQQPRHEAARGSDKRQVQRRHQDLRAPAGTRTLSGSCAYCELGTLLVFHQMPLLRGVHHADMHASHIDPVPHLRPQEASAPAELRVEDCTQR